MLSNQLSSTQALLCRHPHAVLNAPALRDHVTGTAGVEPDEDTFALLMRAHTAAGDMRQAEEVMDHMRDAGALSSPQQTCEVSLQQTCSRCASSSDGGIGVPLEPLCVTKVLRMMCRTCKCDKRAYMYIMHACRRHHAHLHRIQCPAGGVR